MHGHRQADRAHGLYITNPPKRGSFTNKAWPVQIVTETMQSDTRSPQTVSRAMKERIPCVANHSAHR